LRGQSAFARARRLRDGCCPIHGVVMYQVDGFHFDKDGNLVNPEPAGADYTIVGCTRNGCEIRATMRDFTGPAWLLPQFRHLIAGR
jgi:hypothetical protein